MQLRCTVGYQACNAEVCTRPGPVEVTATVEVGDE